MVKENFGLQSVSLQQMLICEVSIYQIKYLDVSMKINCTVVTKGVFFLYRWVFEAVMVDQISDKEA